MSPAAQRAPARRVITPRPEISLYRGRTIGLLRRYFRMSMELGRMPSVISRDFFRAKVSSYRVTSFEDVVILVHDVERCISKLDEQQQQVIARVILQEFTYDEAAPLLGLGRATVFRKTMDALDVLSETFLQQKLLAAEIPRKRQKSCQEAKNDEIAVSA